VDRLALAYASSPLLFWILGSVALAALGTNLLWPLRSSAVPRQPYNRVLGQVLRFCFFVGIPYLALGGWPRQPFQGLLSPENLGLVGPDARWPATRWLSAAGTASVLGLAALLLLTLAWVNAAKAGGTAWLRFPHRPWWAILVDAIYLQVHWAFYLGAMAVVVNDWVPGVFLGLVLIYLEWSLNPFWRSQWHSETRAASTWLRATLALVMAMLFLLTRNLWVCLMVHLFLGMAMRRLAPVLAVTRSG
jgi:hypothetical protein